MKIFKNPIELRDYLRKTDRIKMTLGLSHGVFDLVHPGHIQHFIAAKNEVDILIVSITADAFVNKGPGRPLFDEEIRLTTLAALEAVDFVTISNAKTAENLIDILKPNIYFKGSDYKNSADDPTGKIEDERLVVEKYGGIIKFTNEITSSSSKLINNYFNNFGADTKNWIYEFKKNHSIDEINMYLEKISKLNIALVGEVIIDQYTTVEALAKSSKDPILAFHILNTEIYAGGILAIANNCAGWVNSVSVYSSIGQSDDRPTELAKLLNQNIILNLIQTNRPTITKHRYIDVGTHSKVFETYDFSPDHHIASEFDELTNKFNELIFADLVLVADYGHGLLSMPLINLIIEKAKYLAVNTQSNAGNRGYNTLSKYPQMNFFTANGGEMQLELRSKSPDYPVVVPQLMKKLNAQKSVLTLGAEGVLVFDEEHYKKAPALAVRVVDKVGAGDSVFAISSLLAYLNAPPMIIGLVSNLVAAHEVSQLGHQASLSLGDIRKQIKSLLG